MDNYLSRQQVELLLRGINPKRVGHDKRGNAHVEAYEIRAHLTRSFGFGRWSQRVLAMEPIFESIAEDRVTCAYRAQVELTICAPDGTHLATYTEWATGDAQNFPIASRGDAHDFAVKTAESQALKRAAINIGDAFGLGLYRKGSTAALVQQTLVMPEQEQGAKPAAPVDAHITEQLPREDETPEPQVDPRETNAPTRAKAAETDEPAAPAKPVVVPDPQREQAVKEREAQRIRALALADPPADFAGSPSRWITHLMGEALKAKVGNVEVESVSGGRVKLRSLLEQRLSVVASEQQKAAAR